MPSARKSPSQPRRPRRSAQALQPRLGAAQWGLAEVAAGLRRFYPPGLRAIPTFPGGDAPALARKLQLYAGLDPSQRAELAAAARVAAVELWSWDTVAHYVIEAADL